MNTEYGIIQELAIGDKLRRQTEIIETMMSMDPMAPGYIELMEELSSTMKSIGNFLESYSDNLKSK